MYDNSGSIIFNYVILEERGIGLDYCTEISNNVVKRANVTSFSDTIVSREEFKTGLGKRGSFDEFLNSPAMQNSCLSKKLVKVI